MTTELPPGARAPSGHAARSRRTRQKVLAAADRLFVLHGYLQTTMADLAGEAGVAVQTLYLSFGSKVAVLAAALDVAIVGDDEPVPVLDRDWVRRVREEPDGPVALGIFVAEAAQVVQRVYPLFAVARNASTDPELAELVARNKAQRFVVHAAIAAELAGRPGFNPALTVDQAAASIYAVMSQETYGLLVVERGLSPADWVAWMRRILLAELFP